MDHPLPPHVDTQIMRSVLIMNEVEDCCPVLAFWDSPDLVEWFRMRGYTLYSRNATEYDTLTYSTIPALPFDEMGECIYPYAYHDASPMVDAVPLRANSATGKVVYAQDSQLRHVAIKLILGDGEEYRILRFLHEQRLATLQEHCILPVLDLLPFQGFYFAVMPRWGTRSAEPENHTMREVLHIMHSMLKGLSFLHAHNIIYRDIKMDNVLINHFGDDLSFNFPDSRVELRGEGKLSYALMDYDISTMVPPNINKEKYRRPCQESFAGSGTQPYDTCQGEFDYNPFVYDVGTLGVVFCNHYQHYSQRIPMLAPLLDKMTTRDVASRFTAAEALGFFEVMRSELTEEQLAVEEYPKRRGIIAHDEYDRWEDLSEEFKRNWASYREPPTPFTTKMLRTIYLNQYLPPTFIRSTRWFFFKLTCFPRVCFGAFMLAFVTPLPFII